MSPLGVSGFAPSNAERTASDEASDGWMSSFTAEFDKCRPYRLLRGSATIARVAARTSTRCCLTAMRISSLEVGSGRIPRVQPATFAGLTSDSRWIIGTAATAAMRKNMFPKLRWTATGTGLLVTNRQAHANRLARARKATMHPHRFHVRGAHCDGALQSQTHEPMARARVARRRHAPRAHRRLVTAAVARRGGGCRCCVPIVRRAACPAVTAVHVERAIPACAISDVRAAAGVPQVTRKLRSRQDVARAQLADAKACVVEAVALHAAVAALADPTVPAVQQPHMHAHMLAPERTARRAAGLMTPCRWCVRAARTWPGLRARYNGGLPSLLAVWHTRAR